MVKKFDIKRLRLDKGLKQSEIAAMLNIPQSSISSMEKGKTQVSQNYINILVKKLSLDNVEDYYYDVEEMAYINNQNNRGSNNGYKNNLNGTSGVQDNLILSKLVVIERDLAEYNERNKKLEIKKEELEAENKSLFRQLMALQVLCIKNGIDVEGIISKA